MFNAALPKSPSTSPGASTSLQQGQHKVDLCYTEWRWGFPVAAIIRRTVGALLTDESVRAPVGIELSWKEQGHNKAPQEVVQSSHIFHCFCSPACNRDVLLKSCAFQPLCTNAFNTCIDFCAVTLDLHCQK